MNQKEDSSIIESSLYNHRVLFKKNRSNSITKMDTNAEEPAQQPVKLSLKHNSQKKTDKLDQNDKKVMALEKMSLNNELQNLLSAQKKLENMDKNPKIKLANQKQNKFYLNNSLKSFQFNNAFKKSNTIDSNSKRSPSISNSNLTTDIPSMKMTSSGRMKGATFLNTQKVMIGNKDKVLQMKYGYTTQLTSFADYKSLSQYKTSVDSYAKFIPNIRYPYYFVETPDVQEAEDHSKLLFDENRFDRANPKVCSRWKEEMRKKLDSRRIKARLNSTGQEY